MNDYPEITMEEIVMRARKFAGQAFIEKQLLLDMDVQVVERTAHKLAVQLATKVLSHEISSKKQTVTVSASYYTSPWQRYKVERCAPWVARWFPPKRETVSTTRTVTFTEDLTFPLSTMRYPDELGAPVVYQAMSPPITERHER